MIMNFTQEIQICHPRPIYGSSQPSNSVSGISNLCQNSYFSKQSAQNGSRYAKQIQQKSQIQQMDQLSDHSTSCGSDSSEDNYNELLSYSPPAQILKKQKIGYFSNISHTQIQMNSQVNNNNPSINALEDAKYKTEMCKNWVDTGKCNYGEKCKFAHGKGELNQKMAANKHFKTKKCKQFFETGVCHYGPRCHFLHNIQYSQTSTCSSQYYTKKITFPQLYLNSDSAAVSNLQKPRRLEFFSKLTLQDEEKSILNNFSQNKH